MTEIEPRRAIFGVQIKTVGYPVLVALSVYVLAAIVKKQLGLELSLYKILQILSVMIFEKTPILELLGSCAAELDFGGKIGIHQCAAPI